MGENKRKLSPKSLLRRPEDFHKNKKKKKHNLRDLAVADALIVVRTSRQRLNGKHTRLLNQEVV